MGIYAPDRIHLCRSLLKEKSANLCKHKSQSQNTLQNMSLCTELILKIGEKIFWPQVAANCNNSPCSHPINWIPTATAMKAQTTYLKTFFRILGILLSTYNVCRTWKALCWYHISPILSTQYCSKYILADSRMDKSKHWGEMAKEKGTKIISFHQSQVN